MNYEEFVKERITQLRIGKGVSEYQMSYDLGHSRGYVYNISSGKALPPLREFFAICDYFEITPAQFFVPYLNDEMDEMLHMFLDLNEMERESMKTIMSGLVIKRAVEAHGGNPASTDDDKK